jgi:predicted methyltransferase MtxX (methanogen marker protein 4)
MTTVSARNFWERKVEEDIAMLAGGALCTLGRRQEVNNVWASIYCTSKWFIAHLG